VPESVGGSSRTQKELLKNVTLAVSGLSKKLEKGQESLRSAVENRLDEIRQENAAKLDEMRQTVDDLLGFDAIDQRVDDIPTVSELRRAARSTTSPMGWAGERW
jgi:DNA recombination protein RmuC